MILLLQLIEMSEKAAIMRLKKHLSEAVVALGCVFDAVFYWIK